MKEGHNLIFDFDGVIGDTYDAWTEVQKHLSLQGGGLGTFVDINVYASQKPNHTRDHTLTPEELTQIYERVSYGGKMVHQIGFRLFDEFVREIGSLETPYKAVVSSGSQAYVLPALAKTDIEFTHILAFEDHHSKEEKIEIICKDWGVEPTDVFYFTDTLADIYELKDFVHPQRLIGVTWGYCTPEQLLTELPAENILYSPSDLPKILGR